MNQRGMPGAVSKGKGAVCLHPAHLHMQNRQRRLQGAPEQLRPWLLLSRSKRNGPSQ
jgi:hypothetical protein